MTTATQPVPGWAVYCRLSDENKQHPEYSLEYQLEVIQERLVRPSNLPIIRKYVDVLSGKTPRRPEYQLMKRDAKAGRFSHLAVYRVDRLGRNTLEGMIAFQEFIELGIEVKTASSPDINPNSPDGKLFMGMQMLMAQHEVEIMRQRMLDSKRTILRQGGWPFIAPDGYVNKREASTHRKFNTWIETDPPRFKMWRKAFDLLLTDQYTLDEICHELHNLGYVRKTGTPWVWKTKTGLVKSAKNKLSRGFHLAFYAGRVTSEHYNIRYEEEIRGHWEPVVTPEEFEQGLAILKRRDHHKARQKRHVYLLRDILVLQSKRKTYKLYCSTPSGRNKSYSYYISRSKVDGKQVHIPCDVIDEQIPDWLDAIQIQPQRLPAIRQAYREHLAKLTGPSRREQIEQLELHLQQIQAEEASLVRLFLKKQINHQTYEKLRHEWQTKLKEKEQKLAEMKEDAGAYIDDLETAIGLMACLPELFGQLEKRKQSKLLKLLIQQMVVNKEGEIQTVQLLSPFEYLRSVEQHEGELANSDLRFSNRKQVASLQKFVVDGG